ncbi:MAG: PEP/pyruvate-binding domain-containing protein [Candidatus Hodarchaeota archaeon]
MKKENIFSFSDKNVSLSLAGGKGINLALLSQSGFNVPRGFIITTRFYEKFIKDNNLEDFINERLSDLSAGGFAVLESVSESIRGRFNQCSFPPDLLSAVLSAYNDLGNPPVAVRSSATAEDLADLSFAGQHDTVLNVTGEKTLKEAIITCLSSLWTARAIDYRQRNNISHEGLALAVIVQEMVASDTSGVMFTVNPLTGKRSEYVIDATFGLGEALVSGQIEPDHYVVESMGGKIVHKKLGSKSKSIRSQEGGGTKEVQENVSGKETLSSSNISELIRLGKQVSEHYGNPQDIEWAFANNTLYLLQSRPVTSLFPLPAEFLSGPPRVGFSFGAVQGILGPITPLGQDHVILFLLGVARGFGYNPSFDEQKILWIAGERLWLDLSGIIRTHGSRTALLKFSSFIDLTTQQILKHIANDPWLFPRKRPNVKMLLRVTRIILFIVRRAGSFVLQPRKERHDKQALIEEAIRIMERQSAKLQTLEQKVAYYRKVVDRLAWYGFLPIVPAIPVGYGPLLILDHLASNLTGERNLAYELTRSLPNNPTTEMNLVLGETAKTIKADPASKDRFLQATADELASDYLNGQLPMVGQEALTAFLETYGMRGLGEIDLGRPRWHEKPVPVIKTLQNYIKLPDDQTPSAQFKKGIKAANDAYNKLFSAVRASKGGDLKTRGLNAGITRARELAGLREFPKYSVVRIFWIMRKMLLESGQDLMSAGVLDDARDIFFLRYRELEKLAAGDQRDWKSLVQARRENYEREKQRRLIPRLILSDGRVFYEGSSAKTGQVENMITGSPVSPGVVEGKARVVFDPYESELEPGEILVCPATDPSWTPLFLVAGGLVMEVGGLMQHGAVVAREHNIPAVVSVNHATARIRTGQLLRVNGTTGQITIIDE